MQCSFDAMFVCKQIVELAKENPEVHRMVMPQFQQIYQNETSLMIKHQQVKGFIVRSGKPYLFCTCVDNGIILHRKEGSVTKSSADLFIYSTAVTATLQSLENVFLKNSV